MATCGADGTVSPDDDLFKQEFKYFKSRNPPPKLTRVIDFNAQDTSKESGYQLVPVHIKNLPTISECVSCLQAVSEWKVYQIKHIPGFTFIVNPFRPGCQRYWVHRCLNDFPCKPNKCNIDAHVDLSNDDNIWQLSQDRSEKSDLIDKLRWVTLGYQYDWTAKEYYSDEVCEFPADLSTLCTYIATALGFTDYSAEAAIVNFYHQNSTLAGHTDHSELHHTAPLISISFGQPAIFLLGGKTKSEKPLAMFIRSGDVVVMAESARLCYHAIPRILSNDPLHVMDLHTPSTNHTLQNDSSDKSANQCIRCKNHNDDQTEALIGQSFQRTEFLENKPFKRKAGDETLSVSSDDNQNQAVMCISQQGRSDSSKCENETPVIDNDVMEGNQQEERTNDMDLKINSLNQNMEDIVGSIHWEPYATYLKNNRINMNVRQVFKKGQVPENLSCKNDNKYHE